LTQGIQDKVISKEIDNILKYSNYDDMSFKMKKACDKSEQMQTPWFAGSYIYDYCKDEIIESLKGYQFLENGGIFTA